MKTKNLPSCECGAYIDLSVEDGRHWCPDCFWAEIEKLREALRSLGNAAKTLMGVAIDGQNELHGIKHGGPAQRTLRDMEHCLETMAREAAEAEGN